MYQAVSVKQKKKYFNFFIFGCLNLDNMQSSTKTDFDYGNPFVIEVSLFNKISNHTASLS